MLRWSVSVLASRRAFRSALLCPGRRLLVNIHLQALKELVDRNPTVFKDTVQDVKELLAPVGQSEHLAFSSPSSHGMRMLGCLATGVELLNADFIEANARVILSEAL